MGFFFNYSHHSDSCMTSFIFDAFAFEMFAMSVLWKITFETSFKISQHVAINVILPVYWENYKNQHKSLRNPRPSSHFLVKSQLIRSRMRRWSAAIVLIRQQSSCNNKIEIGCKRSLNKHNCGFQRWEERFIAEMKFLTSIRVTQNNCYNFFVISIWERRKRRTAKRIIRLHLHSGWHSERKNVFVFHVMLMKNCWSSVCARQATTLLTRETKGSRVDPETRN